MLTSLENYGTSYQAKVIWQYQYDGTTNISLDIQNKPFFCFF